MPTASKTAAEPFNCPRCATVTWTRNRYVVRCRYCGHTFHLPKPEQVKHG